MNNFYSRTFGALNESCFLRDDLKLESFYDKNDEFLDLQKAVQTFKAESGDNVKKSDTLLNELDMSFRYLSLNRLYFQLKNRVIFQEVFN